MREIQEFGRILPIIEKVDPQPEVRRNAETAKDWEYADEAAYLYRMAVNFKDRFLDPILLTDLRRLPEPVISFANLRNRNTLAAYTLARNPQGLLYQITMNTEHYIDEERDGKNIKTWSFGRWPPRIKTSSPRSSQGLDTRRLESLSASAERVCEQVYEPAYTWVYVSKKVFGSPSQAQRVFIRF